MKYQTPQLKTIGIASHLIGAKPIPRPEATQAFRLEPPISTVLEIS